MSDSGLLRVDDDDAIVTEEVTDPARESGTLARDATTVLAWAAIAGDEVALEALLRDLAPSLLAIVRATLGVSHPDRDDVLQDCMMAVVDALPSFQGRSSVARYASRIALRLCLERRRRAQRYRAQIALIPEIDVLAAAIGEDDAEAARRRAAVRALLDQLPEIQAETLALRVCLGMSLEEVAEVTGAPLNTVRSRVRLARETLRHRIEADPVLAELLGGAR
jgi:RNA polymerase sigma factor (sigma-70 family)